MLIYPPSTFIYRNDKQPTAHNRICWEGLNDTAKQYFLCTSVVLLTLVGATIGPIYTYSHGGKIVTLYELRIPFFANDPNTEFFVSFAWQGLNSCFGILGIALIESGMSLINNTITVSSMLNSLSLHELSGQLESSNISERKSKQSLKLIFMQIIYWDEYDLFFLTMAHRFWALN